MTRSPCKAALILALSALTGCASTNGNYPSLETRDVERAQGRFEPVEHKQLDVPPVPVNLEGGLQERLDSLLAEAATAHRAFGESALSAEAKVKGAAGSAAGSKPWLTAQVALADLDSARSRTAIPLGDLDRLVAAAALQYRAYTEIEKTRQQVKAILDEEDRTLARIRSLAR